MTKSPLQVRYLTPVQRFVLKLYYGLGLNSDSDAIQFTNPFTDRRYVFSEIDYLRFLQEECRCNGIDGQSYRRLFASFGRRAGKSTLAETILAYEAYQLLQLYNPQGFHGVPTKQRLISLLVSADQDSSMSVRDGIQQLPCLKSLDTPKSPKAHLLDIRPRHNESAPLRIHFATCRSRGLGSRTYTTVVLDDVCQYTSQELPQILFETTWPNLLGTGKFAAFSHRPGDGWFARQLDDSFRPQWGDHTLALRIPTWEANPAAVTTSNTTLEDFGA